MPASVRFLALLIAASVLMAAVSGAVLYGETRHRTRVMAEALTGGNVDAGRAAIGRYGCGACHTIAGVTGARGTVGPALAGTGSHAEIAGVLRNSPDQMIRWLQHPQEVVPGNGMPDQHVSDRDARDMAAYIYTLKD